MLESDNWGFLDNWVTARVNLPLDTITWTPDYSVVDLGNLELTPEAFKHYRTTAAQRIAGTMGNRVALAVSGGADSQAMIQSFIEAGVEVELTHLTFKNNYNQHDTEFAVQTASRFNLPINLIELDAFSFLHHQLDDYADRYRCSSPQFACHHWYYEQLIAQGYTGVVAGGDSWTPAEDGWAWAITGPRQSWLTFGQVNNWPIMGNFLASSWQLNLALACCYSRRAWFKQARDIDQVGHMSQDTIKERYPEKLKSYARFGFDIEPQANKFTGFEKIKDYFTTVTGDHWAFEKRFRWPLEHKWKGLEPKLVLTDKFNAELNQLHSEYSASW
jgi:hypothetical protein